MPMFDKILHPMASEKWAPIVMLDPHPNAPLFDHFIDSPTYQDPVKERIDLFIQKSGAQP